MNMRIRRSHQCYSPVTLTTSAGTTAAIDVRAAAGGAVVVPAGSSITQLTYYAAAEPGLTPLPLYDAAGAPMVQAVAAGRVYQLPDACFGIGLLAVVADAAGTVALSLKG